MAAAAVVSRVWRVSPGEWSRLKKIFEQAVDLDEAARKDLLEKLRRQEPGLVGPIHSVLNEFDAADGTLVPFGSTLLEYGFQAPERIGDYRIIRELGRGG